MELFIVIVLFVFCYSRILYNSLKKQENKLCRRHKYFIGIATFCEIGCLCTLLVSTEPAFVYSALAFIFCLLFLCSTKINHKKLVNKDTEKSDINSNILNCKENNNEKTSNVQISNELNTLKQLNIKMEDRLTIKKNIELGYEKDKKIKDILNNNELNTLNENINNIENLHKQNQGLTAVQSSKKNNINNLNIPDEVLKLLWIGDGELKNYYIPMEFRNYKDMDINFIKTIEPSCIFTELPIEECEDDLSKIDNLDYYPNYFSLQPNQKFCYLKWLEDVMQPIPIGYVFIFYYGLERHLIEGDFESAFQMILKLKDRFNNTSFQAYSTDALLIAIVLKNKTEYFNKIVNYINNPKLLCIIKTFINEPLTAKNLIDIRKYVGFNNYYYIQKEYDLFEKTLENILIDKYKIPVFPTNHKIIENATSYLTLAIANFSLDKRTAKIPNIFSNKTFSEDIKNILLETHTTIKDSKK